MGEPWVPPRRGLRRLSSHVRVVPGACRGVPGRIARKAPVLRSLVSCRGDGRAPGVRAGAVGRRPAARRGARRARCGGLSCAPRRLPRPGRRPLGDPRRRKWRRRLRLRLRQPRDAARVPASGRDTRPLHAPGSASPDAREPRVRRVRPRVRDRRAARRRGDVRHAVRRRVHARDVPPPRGPARRRRDRVPARRDGQPADGGRARRVRGRRGPRPERTARRDRDARQRPRAPARRASGAGGAARAPRDLEAGT